MRIWKLWPLKKPPVILTDTEIGTWTYLKGIWHSDELSARLGFGVSLISDESGPTPEQRNLIVKLQGKFSEIIQAAREYAEQNNDQTEKMGELVPYGLCISKCMVNERWMTIEFTDKRADWVVGVDLRNEDPVSTYSAD